MIDNILTVLLRFAATLYAQAANLELIAKNLHDAMQTLREFQKTLGRQLTLIENQQEQLEAAKVSTERALLEVREVKGAIANLQAEQARIERLEQENREFKADIAGLRKKVQQLKKRLPKEEGSE